jgi:hypothetical protein
MTAQCANASLFLLLFFFFYVLDIFLKEKASWGMQTTIRQRDRECVQIDKGVSQLTRERVSCNWGDAVCNKRDVNNREKREKLHKRKYMKIGQKYIYRNQK